MTPGARLAAAVITSALVAAGVGIGCSSESADDAAVADPGAGTESEWDTSCVDDPDACTLAELATETGVLIGAATSSEWIQDPDYASTLATEFNSLTAENEMKWEGLQPVRGEFDFEGADVLVDFARLNDMAVRGHTLVWAQRFLDATPDWVEQVTDPGELRTVVREHFESVLGHFGDSVDRWDVVNEPLETLGAELYDNHFHSVLGDGYVDEMFVLAHELAPDTELFLNEANIENSPEKAEGLYRLVQGMVERGVPIDGVGLQGHFLGGLPAEGVLADLMTRISGLGLEVAVTELDVVTSEGDVAGALHARQYAQVVTECLVAGCREVTVWGVHDAQTWLDDFLGREDTDPLLFDDDFEPKPAYEATKDAVAAGAG